MAFSNRWNHILYLGAYHNNIDRIIKFDIVNNDEYSAIEV